MVLCLDESDVERLVSMDDALAAVRRVFLAQANGRAHNLVRERVALDDLRMRVSGAIVELPRPESVGNVDRWFAAKVNVGSDDATRTWTLLMDDRSGLRCILPSRRFGQLRTGAATGISVDVLARPDSAVLTCLGAGFHAFTQIEAILRLRPSLRVVVWSRTPQRADAFADKVANAFNVQVEARYDAERATADADIVVTMTTAREPVLHGGWVKPGAHVVLAGSNSASKREADGALWRRASGVYVDDVEQARRESGDLIMAAGEGALAWENVQLLATAIIQAADGSLRRDPSGITVFSSHGIGAWDAAMAVDIYQRAIEKGAGVPLPIDGSGVSRQR